ncbi:MAG: nucleotidyltransferase domain-containing protein [Candidatus Helarchaeota archaeon]
MNDEQKRSANIEKIKSLKTINLNNELKMILQQIIEYFNKLNDAISIYLFGSVAKGNYTKNSDLDLLLVLNNSADNRLFYKIIKTKEYRKFDSNISKFLEKGLNLYISTLNELIENNPTLLLKVLEEGILLWGRNLIDHKKECEKKIQEGSTPEKLLKILKSIKITW